MLAITHCAALRKMVDFVLEAFDMELILSDTGVWLPEAQRQSYLNKGGFNALYKLLASGGSLADYATETGIEPSAIFFHARRDAQFDAALSEAFAARDNFIIEQLFREAGAQNGLDEMIDSVVEEEDKERFDRVRGVVETKLKISKNRATVLQFLDARARAEKASMVVGGGSLSDVLDDVLDVESRKMGD